MKLNTTIASGLPKRSLPSLTLVPYVKTSLEKEIMILSRELYRLIK
jgi:hypothetical protein